MGGGPTDNLNINKPGSPNKVRRGGGLKNVLGQKWQPVISNHGCLLQNFFAQVEPGATITLN